MLLQMATTGGAGTWQNHALALKEITRENFIEYFVQVLRTTFSLFACQLFKENQPSN